MTTRTWAHWTTGIAKLVAETALASPPLDSELSRCRLVYILGELSCAVYDVTEADVNKALTYVLPLQGQQGSTTSVTAKLVHVRDVDCLEGDDRMVAPQKFGVWHVEGLGLVVAFRGTASVEDMLINIEIQPTFLQANGQPVEGVQLHRGFYEGARQHLEDITGFLESVQLTGPHRQAVWLTGHSLGGGYATAALMHLLANDQFSELFNAGGGLVTFGSPMVLYSTSPSDLYHYLLQLQRRKPYIANLNLYHVVNCGDMVPRLLGTGLSQLHMTLQYYFPSLQGVQDVAEHYQPCGMYLFILNGQIRALITKATNTTPQRSECCVFGDALYAQRVISQLEVLRSLPTLIAGIALNPRAPQFHGIVHYLMDMKAYVGELAAGRVAGVPSTSTGEEMRDAASLFDLTEPPSASSSSSISRQVHPSSSASPDMVSTVLQHTSALLACQGGAWATGISKALDVYREYRCQFA